MNTIILAVCEINYRHHLVGMWPSIADAIEELRPTYAVSAVPKDTWGEPEGYGVHPTHYNALATWEAVDTGIDSSKVEGAVSAVGADVDGFTLYEVDPGNLMGYLDFEED